MPLIKNRKMLATSDLRRDALDIFEAGIEAINTTGVINSQVNLKGSKLKIGKMVLNLDNYRNIFVIGIGKAAFDAAKALEKIMGKRITDGLILDVKGGVLKRMKSVIGTHPLPSLPNMKATGEIIALLKHVDSRDLVLAIVSGGGSALLCWPYEMSCDELATVTQTLMRGGATIEELNIVRKHLSEILGGQFARLAHPARIVSLVFSDVADDDLSVIASGPTVLDVTTIADARKILDKYDVLKICRLPNCQLLETPKDPIYFKDVTNILLVNNQVATKAMVKKARELGYRAKIYSTHLVGEASEAGKMLANLPRPGEAYIAAGETTVTVSGHGRGGRNQELALGALSTIIDGQLVASIASDGIDNGPAAGALADYQLQLKAKKLGINPATYLKNNNSFAFFNKVGGQIVVGQTGANVSDLMIALRAR